MVCDDSVKALSLLKFKSKIEFIVLFDDLTEEVREKASEANVKVFTMSELLEVGKSCLADPVVSTSIFETTRNTRDIEPLFLYSHQNPMMCAQFAIRRAQPGFQRARS